MKSRFRMFVLSLLVLVASSGLAQEDPLAGINQYLYSGRAKEARVIVLKARDAYVAQKDVANEGVSWLLLGILDVDDPLNARLELETAATKFSAAEDFFCTWLSLLTLAQIEQRSGTDDAAIAAHERALAVLRQAAEPNTHLVMKSMQRLAGVFGGSDIPIAPGPLFENPDLMKPLLARLAEAMSNDAYASALIDAGRLDEAEHRLERAKESAMLFGGLFDGSLTMHSGDLRREQWRLEEARELYLKALQGPDLAPSFLPVREGTVELDVLRHLADLDLMRGRVDEALAWNDQALKLVRGSTNPKREAGLLEHRGALLNSAGKYDAARSTFEEALAAATKDEDVISQGLIHTDLGTLATFKGAYGSAAQHFEKAIALYQAAKQPELESVLWIMLADIQSLLNVQDNATESLENARSLAKKSGFKLASELVEMAAAGKKLMGHTGQMNPMEEAMNAWFTLRSVKELMAGDDLQRILNDTIGLSSMRPPVDSPWYAATEKSLYRAAPLLIRGNMLFRRGDYDGARKAWQQALEVTTNQDSRAGILAVIGVSYWLQQKYDDAIRSLKQASDTLEASASDVKVEELLTSYMATGRRSYYEMLIEMLIQQGRPAEAFAQAERARARAFLQLVGNHRFNPERGAEPQLVREAEILRTDIADRERKLKDMTATEAGRGAADLEREKQRYRDVMVRVKVSNGEYDSMTNVQPLDIDAARREVPEGATLVSYFITPHALHAWVIERSEWHHAVLPVDEAGMRRILCWAGAFGPPADQRGVRRIAAGCEEPATAEEAFAKLVAPLVPFIHSERLIIVPHAGLHYVPFAALRNGQSQRYLIEDYTLTYVPSVSTLQFLRAKESPVTGTALVLGDPESPLPWLPHLAGAKEEATAVAQQLGTTPHLGADARESLLRQAGGKADVIHLAAHGIYDPNNPLFSRIALAAGDGEDGSLTVDEILSSVDLTGVNLVVLSACQSAAGARSGGDEVVGLTRALLYAGTPGVISTLWNIGDAETDELMKTFYRRFTAGETAADALRQAQLTAIREQHAEPKDWAAFTLSGDPHGRWPTAH